MGEQTNIGWTEKTWNPFQGCHKISPGCKYCYMFRDKLRYGQDPNVVVRSKTTFRDPLKWDEPSMVFTCSWSDWFIEEADPWREEAWDIVRMTPQHTYQILTKRPERIAKHLPSDWDRQDRWRHVWLGVSVENQAEADKRIPYLLATPAAVRWLSCEPLLGALDLDAYLDPVGFQCIDPDCLHRYVPFVNPSDYEETEERDPVCRDCGLVGTWTGYERGIDWAVFGGESGSDRVMNLDDLRAGVDQCIAAGVPVFVKQDSGPRPGLQGRIPDEYWLKESPSPR